MGNIMMSLTRMIGGTLTPAQEEFQTKLMEALTGWLTIAFAFVGVAGIFFAIYLGLRLATAEDDGKRKQAKAQLIWTIIAIIAVFVLIAVFNVVGSILQTSLNDVAPQMFRLK